LSLRYVTSNSRDVLTTEWSDLNKSWHKYSSCDCELLKRSSRSEVRVQRSSEAICTFPVEGYPWTYYGRPSVVGAIEAQRSWAAASRAGFTIKRIIIGYVAHQYNVSVLQIVDVVRNKVREVAMKTWKRPNIEHITLYRAFNRLFNRMTSNRGQGLWDCLLSDRSVHHHYQRCSRQVLGCIRLSFPFLFSRFLWFYSSFPPLSPSYVVRPGIWESVVSSLSGVRGRATAANSFWCI